MSRPRLFHARFLAPVGFPARNAVPLVDTRQHVKGLRPVGARFTGVILPFSKISQRPVGDPQIALPLAVTGIARRKALCHPVSFFLLVLGIDERGAGAGEIAVVGQNPEGSGERFRPFRLSGKDSGVSGAGRNIDHILTDYHHPVTNAMSEGEWYEGF